jgi:hypothetical protein
MANKLKVYMLSCPGDPTKYLDPFGPDEEPNLYSTKELADLALQDYVKEFPDDDPPAEVLEIEVKQTYIPEND